MPTLFHSKRPINRRVAIQRFASIALASQLSAEACGSRGNDFDFEQADQVGCEIEFPTMGSSINLRWLDTSADRKPEVLLASKDIAERWVSILSDYEPSSEMSVACEQADSGNWVPVSCDLWNVLELCDRWNRLSGGAFDAGLGALSRIRRQRRPATNQQWKDATLCSGWKWIELDASNHSFRTLAKGFRLDFGAIGKGLVADAIALHLQTLGIQQFAVNASGNMRVGQAPGLTPGWPVSVDVPTAPSINSDKKPQEANLLFQWRLKECGVATSGDRWQRFPDAASPDAASPDNKASHILDPSTLQGVAGSHSATVIAKNAADADAIATATIARLNNDLAGWLQTLYDHRPDVQIWVLALQENGNGVRMRQMKHSEAS